jgi:hypothetical protein
MNDNKLINAIDVWTLEVGAKWLTRACVIECGVPQRKPTLRRERACDETLLDVQDAVRCGR